MSQPLRGTLPTDAKLEAERIAVGGFRDATESLRRLPSVAAFGEKLGAQMSNLLDTNPAWTSATVACIGKDDVKPPPAAILAVRNLIATACQATDLEPVSNATCSTDIRAGLLEAWRVAAGDPASAVVQWLTNGSPAGIRRSAESCGIFPDAATDIELNAESLFTDYEDFRNDP